MANAPESPHAFPTIPGGAYLIRGEWVNADGKPIDNPNPPKQAQPVRSGQNQGQGQSQPSNEK